MHSGLENYSKNDSYVLKTKKIKGKYGFIVILVYEDGTERRQQHAGFSRKEDADIYRDIIIGQIRKRTYLVYGSTRFDEYMEHWLENEFRVRAKKYSTYYSYRNVINNHIIPVLGNKMMRTINSADIIRLYGSVNQYSSSVAKQVKTIMNTFLEYAQKNKAIEVNVAKNVRIPKSEKESGYHVRTIKKDKTLSVEQVKILIEGSKKSKIYIMILFNVVMGLRCSEIIGLKYSDVDFINQKLTIRRQLGRDINKNDSELDPKTYTKQEISPKTNSSTRTIDIPDIVFDAILNQRKVYDACKKRRSKTFQDDGYICCSSYGRPRSKNYHFKEFKRLLKELELPDVRWHDLRSTCATILLMEGISPKAIAKNMGHSEEIVTIDHYIDQARVSAVKLDALDSFILEVVPKIEEQNIVNDCSDIEIDISEFIPK